ncbi:MAG: hypothetical protein SNJ49_15040 [Chloracidobacterium sp.]
MTIADVLACVFGALLVGGSLSALTILITLVFPKVVANAASALATAPTFTTLLGGVVGLLALLLAVGLANTLPKLGILLALSITLGALSLLALGGAGLARHLAGRLYPDRPAPSWGALGQAVALILGAIVTPLVGWFILLPLLASAMVGAGLRGALPCVAVWRRVRSARPTSTTASTTAASVLPQ